MNLDEAIKHCDEEADMLAGSECGLDHAQLATWLRDYKQLKAQQAKAPSGSKHFMYAAQMSLCLKEIEMPCGFLTSAFNQMVAELKTLEKDTPEHKELVNYAQILHGAIQSIESAKDVVTGLSLLMFKNEVG